MLRETRKEDKSDVYDLWKQAYPNLNRNELNFYFKHLFDQGVCVVEEKDQRIVSSVQMNTHALCFQGKKLLCSYLLGAATLPDYRRRGYMKKIMESVLEEASENYLITLTSAFHPRLFEPYGFHTVYYRKQYLIHKEELHKVTMYNVSYSADAKELLQAYRRFICHFDGNYEREEAYYDLLLKELVVSQKQMVVYREQDGTVSGYLVFRHQKEEVRVIEAIYLDAAALMRMLKAAIGKAEEILVEVSQSERLEKVFPLSVPKKIPYLMARINDYELFNKLYASRISSVKEAFALLRKPLWNRGEW